MVIFYVQSKKPWGILDFSLKYPQAGSHSLALSFTPAAPSTQTSSFVKGDAFCKVRSSVLKDELKARKVRILIMLTQH